MRVDFQWSDPLALDVRFGYLDERVGAPRQHQPQVVLNGPNESVLRVLRHELGTCETFLFSVAFVTPRAIALLKQELVEFAGTGTIVTSDYLGFNSPSAFSELLNLRNLGIDVRIHTADAFHPKGYIFGHPGHVTALVGSSNLTENALVTNHEWNLRVTAARGSDLSNQLLLLEQRQRSESARLTREWIARYESEYAPPPPRRRPEPHAPIESRQPRPAIEPNQMQREALGTIQAVRTSGERRALVISATGTGKTMLSALDVRAAAPKRLLFLVHREQIIDRTIQEYQRVIDAPAGHFGKLTGSAKQWSAQFLFATVQTMSRPDVLTRFDPDAFDYVIVDEAHRAASPTYRLVLEYLRPAFLLGMTATPERTDSHNVFELFDFNVPYEIRLNRALEEDMLTPFHYYGIADVTLADGRTLTDKDDLTVMISPERVTHLIHSLEVYGQASIPPRGLIFCSRKDEAHALSRALNQRTLRGVPLRTMALTGDDPVSTREGAVARLERGELDYLLTVDVFNEGVDIPTINQIIMLRQTQSSIVFVQQLGRGLRKAVSKDYVVVLDFIGNYTNNFLIPIALFGDESLNKESLKQHLIAAEEAGVLPGLASIRFDRISQQRVLQSIASAKLDSLTNLKKAVETLRNRLGALPRLMDFLRFDSVDPVLLATRLGSYPALLERLFRISCGLTGQEMKFLELVSCEVFTAKRPHEFIALRALLRTGGLTLDQLTQAFADEGLAPSRAQAMSAISSLTLEEHSEVDQKRFWRPMAGYDSSGLITLDRGALASYRSSTAFRSCIDDLIETGSAIADRRYAGGTPFVAGWQYSRKEVTRLLCWPRKWTSTLYGYRVDRRSGQCAIFVTLHKSEDVSASTAYEDSLLDTSTMLWYTRSRRTLASDEVKAIVANDVALHVFVKKDDAEGTDFYYLGRAEARDAEQTTMMGQSAPLDVVRMHLHFAEPIQSALFDYFHPMLTE
ncbi:DEAD/DEAH box helicase [Propioniciclava coleopterorum]|uniref:DEAD/DEAH box helicase n=1 Tax=Propioniciclava coleopterorum TaxID=2714937 RepID=A0A6G7Y4J4_9ACTN|nr:DEAD/DEAH box helicase [Propioniciclava coleopterorum]QIK71537.1 DEAD/DEAH box helicase [Propioniciclava coleopterorum]